MVKNFQAGQMMYPGATKESLAATMRVFLNDPRLPKNERLSAAVEAMSMDDTVFIPEYHKEYQKRYPSEKEHYEKLTNSYIVAHNGHVPDKECALANAPNSESYEEYSRLLHMRWRCPSIDAVIEFLSSNPQPGDIFKDRPKPTVYGSGGELDMSFYQTMKNTAEPQIFLNFGKTYIGIGFTDMSTLVKGLYQDELNSSLPLLFIGYDMCEMVIARNLILYEMMSSGCNAENILQVMVKYLIISQVSC